MTVLAGVIGDPVAHSRSPAIHNAAFAALGLDWRFLAFQVAAGSVPDALVGMRALRMGGLSVTMPHKEAVVASLDSLSEVARTLRAVNTVVPTASGLHGDNTDGAGLLDSLRADNGFDPRGRKCAVVGSGGAARAAVHALVDAGAGEVLVVARSPDGAAALSRFGGRSADAAEAGAAELVIDATPVGMPGVSGEPLVGARRFGPGQLIVDLVYEPLETPWLATARAAGATTANGMGMLVHQAARAFRAWTGEPAPIDVMRTAATTSEVSPHEMPIGTR